MSQAIIIPRKSFGGIFAIPELAKVFVFLFFGAVAGGHVTLDVFGPIELLIAGQIGAGKISAMSLDMFADPTHFSMLLVHM